MRLTNKTAIVTGSSKGIGEQIAIDLAREGYNLVLCARSIEKLLEIKKEAETFGVKCLPVKVDLSDLNNIQPFIDKIKDEFPSIDVLINCAGVLYQDGLLNVTPTDWEYTLKVNLTAPFFLAQQVLKLMIERNTGYIINIGSTASLCVPPAITSYGVSKAGLVGATQALYEEAKKYNVKVSMIYPGMTDTEMLRSAGTGTTPDQWMLPEDISSCVIFLLKTSSRMVVKEIIPWAVGHDSI